MHWVLCALLSPDDGVDSKGIGVRSVEEQT